MNILASNRTIDQLLGLEPILDVSVEGRLDLIRADWQDGEQSLLHSLLEPVGHDSGVNGYEFAEQNEFDLRFGLIGDSHLDYKVFPGWRK